MKLIEKLSLYEGATSEEPGLQFLQALAMDLGLKIVKDKYSYKLEVLVKDAAFYPIRYSSKSASKTSSNEVKTGIILDTDLATLIKRAGLRDDLKGYDLFIDNPLYHGFALSQKDSKVPLMSILSVLEKAVLIYLKGATLYYRGLSDLKREIQNRLASMLQISFVEPPSSILSYFIEARLQGTKDPYTSIELVRVPDKRITNYPIMFAGLAVNLPRELFSSGNNKKSVISRNFFVKGRKARKMLVEKYPGIFPLWFNAQKGSPGMGSIRFKESLPLDKALDMLEFMVRYTIKEREARKAREPKY